jgi:hypothetical protein
MQPPFKGCWHNALDVLLSIMLGGSNRERNYNVVPLSTFVYKTSFFGIFFRVEADVNA